MARFKKGESGNPRGRPKGTTEAGKLRKQISKHAPEIIENLVKLANAGDVQASKILLDKVVPGLKSESLPAKLPIDAENLSGQGEQVLGLLAGGHIPLDDAAGLLAAMGNLAKLKEFDDLVERIERLEQRQ